MLIVLDMDDTLYLEREYVRSGFHAVGKWIFEEVGIRGFFEDAWRLFEDGVRGNIFDRVLENRGIMDDSLVLLLVRVYRSHEPEIKMLPDAKAFLQSRSRSNLALITDGPSVSQWAKIRALKLEQYIGKVIVTDDLGPGWSKPNPEVFRKTQGDLSSESCCYVADNPQKDFAGPSFLGWSRSVRIRREGSLHFDLPTPEGCIEIESFNELPVSVKMLNLV